MVARLSRRPGGFHGPAGVSFLIAGMVAAGQPGARAWRRVMAVVICAVQGQVAARRSRRRRPPRTTRPAQVNRRSRSRLGSHRRASPVRASICVQASRSQASATISHHTWFWSKPCRVISSHPPPVFDVHDATAIRRVARGGRGYLAPSITQMTGGFGARAACGDAVGCGVMDGSGR
jgi:hypothetical protein